MLAKIIVHAPTREQAVARMRFALGETVVLGMGTNQSFLQALAEDSEVIAGRMHTGYLGTAYADFAPIPSPETLALILAARKAGHGKSHANTNGATAGKSFPSPWAAGANR
jgi:acetyl-CoA/propionyl-CoA carboxylase biotin carboxyl carrier protein